VVVVVVVGHVTPETDHQLVVLYGFATSLIFRMKEYSYSYSYHGNQTAYGIGLRTVRTETLAIIATSACTVLASRRYGMDVGGTDRLRDALRVRTSNEYSYW